jgi:hypothetical protein
VVLGLGEQELTVVGGVGGGGAEPERRGGQVEVHAENDRPEAGVATSDDHVVRDVRGPQSAA